MNNFNDEQSKKNFISVIEIFGSNVFNDSVMQTRLPKASYEGFRRTIEEGAPLDPQVAEVIANAMKDWAIEKGATHFTHWFQPLTGVTAEKHDSFISPTNDGKVIMEFSGKSLIKGESDASSFPSGGLRATFEARGYTAWDCTSPAFLKEDPSGVTLYIPTIFCSYTGEVLDKKAPLMLSMEALSKQAVRLLALFGKPVKKVIATVGPEQEYFLIDKATYDKRLDLQLTGRTLFGAKPPKGQELEDHYYGSIKERIAIFMKELDIELWKLGVSAKTKHNEVAPAQHELAPVFTSTNIAVDHNQLVMETMKKVALRHNLVCLLHEKPFAGVNGSGKHNNWSMSTDKGQNLLEPGKTPSENAQFLIFLCSVIQAVDEYADLLRLSATNPGNDHRLGANEAPPAIISIYLGEQLMKILEEIETGVSSKSKDSKEFLQIGVSTLPSLPKDSTDRNRTSPFAFTGNKFEFRMVPSSASVASPNYTLNTIVAETLSKISDKLEKAKDFNSEVQNVLQEIIKNHKRVLFNGNNYSEEWVTEAERRGLPNIKNCVDAIPSIIADKNVEVFEKHKVFTRKELESRYEISLENYVKTINIEALTMLNMCKRQILPSVFNFATKLAKSINLVKETGIGASVAAQSETLIAVSHLSESLNKNVYSLEKAIEESNNFHGDSLNHAKYFRDEVFKIMSLVRADADKLETICDKELWPFPTYADILYNV